MIRWSRALPAAFVLAATTVLPGVAAWARPVTRDEAMRAAIHPVASILHRLAIVRDVRECCSDQVARPNLPPVTPPSEPNVRIGENVAPPTTNSLPPRAPAVSAPRGEGIGGKLAQPPVAGSNTSVAPVGASDSNDRPIVSGRRCPRNAQPRLVFHNRCLTPVFHRLRAVRDGEWIWGLRPAR